MIVGTEGPDVIQDQDRDQEQSGGKDTTPAQGQATDNDDGGNADYDQKSGATPEQKNPQQQQQQQQQQEQQQAEAKPKGGGGNDPTNDILNSLALAEAMKPLEGPSADLYSPDKLKARTDLETAYERAISENGELRFKLEKAHDRFDRAAADMLGPRLDAWLKLFDKGGAFETILNKRAATRTKLDATMGANEKLRADTQADAKRWSEAFANWSSPVDKMTAIVGEYADKIDKLNADINNDVGRNLAMLSFWLEVAPKHLQLDGKPLSADAQASLDKVAAKLKAFELDKKLMNGKARDDGSLYVTKNLGGARRYVLRKWVPAAKSQAKAEATFKGEPDDAATLKQRWDELKDQGWLKEAKSKLESNGG